MAAVFAILLCLASSCGEEGHPVGVFPLARAQQISDVMDTLQTETEFILSHLDQYSTPQYLRWKKEIRAFWQHHYSSMLLDVRRGDGLGALLAYLRMKMQLEFSLDHTPICYETPLHSMIPLPQDWTFPADPWGPRNPQ